MTSRRIPAEYVLPLRWTSDDDVRELTAYLHRLSRWIDVTVIDGSSDDLFAAHARSWQGVVRHLPVADDAPAAANGKVSGVLTGIAASRHDRVVIADDDVRYREGTLRALVSELDDADLVKPQNFFDPLPWHARWDTARTLVNRAFGSDYPGTYAVRRAFIVGCGGYDGDCLFENLELERTVRAAGGRIANRPGLFVARRPPSRQHFRSQRVRQAFESFAQPGRLAAEAAIVPAVLGLSRRPRLMLTAVLAVVAVAEMGRRRAGGRLVFPASSALWAPLWVLERGFCAWLAILQRLRGGIRYNGHRIARAAHPQRVLRARLQPMKA